MQAKQLLKQRPVIPRIAISNCAYTPVEYPKIHIRVPECIHSNSNSNFYYLVWLQSITGDSVASHCWFDPQYGHLCWLYEGCRPPLPLSFNFPKLIHQIEKAKLCGAYWYLMIAPRSFEGIFAPQTQETDWSLSSHSPLPSPNIFDGINF